MDDRHPKRRKDKYNPYTLSMIDGKCYLSFRDGQGVPHRLELDVKLYAVFDRFELDDLSFLNEQERHLDWTELNEELLSRRSAQEPAPVEDAVYESMQTQALREGVNQLPEVQKINKPGVPCLRGLSCIQARNARLFRSAFLLHRFPVFRICFLNFPRQIPDLVIAGKHIVCSTGSAETIFIKPEETGIPIRCLKLQDTAVRRAARSFGYDSHSP